MNIIVSYSVIFVEIIISEWAMASYPQLLDTPNCCSMAYITHDIKIKILVENTPFLVIQIITNSIAIVCRLFEMSVGTTA